MNGCDPSVWRGTLGFHKIGREPLMLHSTPDDAFRIPILPGNESGWYQADPPMPIEVLEESKAALFFN